MRIITGKARGIPLRAPEGLNTRPTAERTKEAIFSVLQFSLEGRKVLDIFAGSGQMGLEALSRGASECCAIEADRRACDVIRGNVQRTGLGDAYRLLQGDAVQMLGKLKGTRFSIVFMDPPYASGLLPEVLRRLHAYGLCEPNAYLVCEAPSPEAVFGEDATLGEYYDIYRTYRYGAASVTVLRPHREEEA